MSKYISGKSGQVRLSTGYAQRVHQWGLTVEATLFENTQFDDYAAGTTSTAGPAGVLLGRMRTRELGLRSYSGEYRCRQVTSAYCDLSGLGYNKWLHKLDLQIISEPLAGTRFADNWERVEVSGLFDLNGSAEVWIDDTDVLPLAGEEASLTFQISASQSIAFRALYTRSAAEVARDGSARLIRMDFENAGQNAFVVGVIPLPGVLADAVFVAEGLIAYAGQILLHQVSLTIDANRTSGDWRVACRGNLALAAGLEATTTA